MIQATQHIKAGERMLGGEGRDGLQGIFERARALSDTPHTDMHIVELLSVYVKFESQHGFAWFLFGDALRSVGRLQEAEGALLKAVDLAPKETDCSKASSIARAFSRMSSSCSSSCCGGVIGR
jgi:hypothetical protein